MYNRLYKMYNLNKNYKDMDRGHKFQRLYLHNIQLGILISKFRYSYNILQHM